MRLSRYSIVGIMVALLLSAVAIMPVFGAVTGSISANKTFVAPGGVATITVDDADLNILLSRTDTETQNWGATNRTIFFDIKDSAGQEGASNFATGSAAGDEISGTPVIASNTIGSRSPSNDYVMSVFNKKTGRVSVTYGGAEANASDTLTITYKLAAVNTTTIDVTSPSDSTGIKVTLTETGADTGKFAGAFNVTVSTDTQSNDAADKILAVPGQNITVKYVDADPSGNRQTSVTVENTKPAGVLVSPASKSVTSSRTPKLTVDFTDTDSTIDSGKITFVISSALNATSATDFAGSIIKSSVTTTAITNGFRAETTLGTGPAGDMVAIQWYATAEDKAGNIGVTDADPATAGSQHFILYTDNTKPEFSNSTASAGAWYDVENATLVTDTTKSINTSIGIKLPDALSKSSSTIDLVEQLSAGTITPADFDVDSLKQASGTTLSDVTPTAANVYSGAPNWIFLTVPAMSPDAKPVINLKDTSGGIGDTAGNSQTTGTVTAADKQAPRPTYSLNRSLHSSSVTVTITTNEAGGIPTVTAKGAGGTVAQTVALIGTNTYESTITRTGTGAVGTGLQSLKIVVTDANGNSNTLGSDTVDDKFPTSKNIPFYIDNNLPAPTVTANNNTLTTTTQAIETSVPFFITAVFTDEGKEFGLCQADKGCTPDAITVTTASISKDLDPQNTVTISTVTLDGTSLLSQVDTQDNITFNIAVLDITTGDHELEIVAKDAAGNEYSSPKLVFSVTARKAYSVAMSAGWNLVSFPGTPSNTAIQTVIPSTHPATEVLTYNDGIWAVATRSAGGTWEGTLTTIDGSMGYWINTSSSQPLESLLALPSVGSAATLPSIAVEQGWNLVSVIDLAQTKQGSTGDTRTGSSYFTSIDWAVAYTYDSTARTWTRVTSATGGGNVKNGQGVWVWANKDGTLIP